MQPTSASPLCNSLRTSGVTRGMPVSTAGIRQFHQTKGFDPDSQEVAIHLGHLLYELSSEIHIPFAHIDDQHFRGVPEEEDPSGSTTDPENIFESANAGHADASSASPNQGSGHSGLSEEMLVSGTFKFVLIVQLSLISCHVLLWLYDHLWNRTFE
ncbi:hypothetical protein B0H14DRAFT_1028322 [Mycena olivaceomarginata]|nr:hypothetical protein B0H14DRAFT_1028322 [Mycena olivaceomarginata]